MKMGSSGSWKEWARMANAPLALFLGAAMTVAFVAFSPGLLNADSIDMLHQSVTGQYHDWHSPLMSHVWSLANFLNPGPSVMLLLQLVGFSVGVYLILGKLFHSPLAAILAAALILGMPPVFASLGIVNKDALGLAVFALAVGLFFSDLVRSSTKSMVGWLVAVTVLSAIRPDYLPFVFWFCVVKIWSVFAGSTGSQPGSAGRLSTIGKITVTLLAAAVTNTVIFVSVQVLNHTLLNAQRRLPI